MAYNKVYNRTYWKNDKVPAINETNLNNIEKGIDDIDSRVVEIGNDVSDVKSGLSDVNNGLVSNVFDPSNEQKGYEEDYNFPNGIATYRTVNLVGNFKAGTYYLKSFARLSGGTSIIRIVTNDGQNLSKQINWGKSIDNTISFTLDNDVTGLGLSFSRGADLANFGGNTLEDCKIVLATSMPNEFVPFTGSSGKLNVEVGRINNSLKDLAYGKVASKNIFDKSKFIDGKVVDYATGNILNFDGYCISDYIEIEPNKTYTKQGFTEGAEHWMYDANKRPLMSITSNTFTVTNDTKYIVLSCRIENKDKAMLEKGSQAHPYEPYIGQSVKSLNDSLNDQGLLNKATSMRQGGYNENGVSNTWNDRICTTTPISVNPNDKIYAEANATYDYIQFVFFNGSTFVSQSATQTSKSAEITVPSNVNACYVSFIYANKTITPSKAIVYVNNDIKSLKADLQNAGSGSNYSTTEKVVGKWIDGRDIYEQTFDIDVVSAGGNVRRVLASGIDFCVDSKGYISGDCGVSSFGIVKYVIPFYGGGTYGNGTVSANIIVLQNGDMELLYRWNVTGKDLKIQVVAQYVKK